MRSQQNNHAETPQSVDQSVVQTELTAKRWKRLQLVGAAWIVAGIFVLCLAAIFDSRRSPITYYGIATVGTVILGYGAVTYIKGRFSGWWHHG